MADSTIDFTGQVAIVTGAGRGLGRQYALDLARRGAGVVVNDVGVSMHGAGADRSVADGVVEEIVGEGGSAVASYDPVDDPDGGAAIVDAAVSAFGRLDAVVANAGIFEMIPFDELSIEQWQRMRSVHLDGAFHVSQPAYRVMKAQGYGRLVFVTSNTAAFGQENVAHYAAAKGGILGLTHALANEAAPHGVLVNSVMPMGRTRMMTESIGTRDPNPVVDRLFEETTPERVVAVVSYLASRSCELSHHHISAAAGRFAHVFLGLGEGWLADPSSTPTAEDIAAHLDEITSTDPHSVPGAVADEIVELLQRLDII